MSIQINPLEQELVALKKEYEDFVYIVSHDLKSPLRAISNISCWIEEDLEGNTDPSILENFAMLKGRVSRLEKMIDALLELSRVNRRDLDIYKINIVSLINECVQMTQNSDNIFFKYEFDITERTFETYGEKLKCVIKNVLDNAVKFHDRNDKNIVIEVSENDTYYNFKITDDGPGIPLDIEDKIFTIFYTQRSKDVLETTGAGLAIADKIIKMVGGTISCQKTTNAETGATFAFSWPKKIVL